MNKDIFWGYLSQFLQYGAALLVLPFLLKHLSSAELGVWYVFMTIAALVTMLDIGFTPTLSRNVSYVLSGAKQLFKAGHEVVDAPSAVDFGLLNLIIDTARRIFLVIACIAFLLLSTAGSWYILRVSHGQVEQQTVVISWAVFVLATVINLYFKYYTPLLQGRGLYAAFYKSSAIANLCFVLVTAVLLQCGLTLLAVSLGFLASALVGRYLSWYYFCDRSFQSSLQRASKSLISSNEIFGILWHNAWRMGLGVMGAFLILRANILLSSVYLGLSTTAAYALTLQVYSVLQSMSTVLFNIQQPKLAQYRISNEIARLKRTIEIGFGCALAVFFTGAVCLIYLGPILIRRIGAQTELLPLPLLIWVAVMVMLELTHSLAAGVIVTGNRVPFVKPALLSGVAITLLSWAGLKYADLGIEWLIAAQFVVQLTYNNWKWPWMVWIDLYRRSPDQKPNFNFES